MVHYSIKGKSDTIFVLFHGLFSSSKDEIIIKTREILGGKYSVMTIDYSGHGKSSGNLNDLRLKTVFRDRNFVLDRLEDYKKIFLIGFSFGAYPILTSPNINRFNGIIMFNPVSDMKQLVFRKGTQEDLDNYTNKHRDIPLKTKILILFDMFSTNIYDYAKKIKIPVYVRHIKNDKVVPSSQSEILCRHLPNRKFDFSLGSNHALTDELINGRFEKDLMKALTFVDPSISIN